eukprot:4594746-Pleurochrysis_carterae.AAC.1
MNEQAFTTRMISFRGHILEKAKPRRTADAIRWNELFLQKPKTCALAAVSKNVDQEARTMTSFSLVSGPVAHLHME